MKNLMEHSNPLFARFSVYLNLKEFNYLEASRFYENLSPYDKVAYYVVFGGSPFVLKQLDYTKGLEYNIKNTYLNETSSINMFASDGYTSDITTKETAKKIFEALGNTKLRYAKLEEKLGLEKNGLSNKQLKTLIDMQFINKNCPINKKNDNKKVTYYINNQMLRFYYNYIYGKTGLASRKSKNRRPIGWRKPFQWTGGREGSMIHSRLSDTSVKACFSRTPCPREERLKVLSASSSPQRNRRGRSQPRQQR